MVAVMGDVFALEYNFHVPLYFEGQAVRTRGWMYVTMFFFFCWSVGYFSFCGFSLTLVFSIGVYLFFLRRGVVWCGVSRLLVEFFVLWCHCVSCPK
jgi:hypothetical protein